MIMAIFLKYFWFNLLLVAAANAWFIQRRARPLIAKNPLLQLDANKVSITLVLMIGIPSSLLGIIQVKAGYESPLYIFSNDLNDIHVLGAWLVMASLRVFILYWLWFTRGLESYLAVTPINFQTPIWVDKCLPSSVANKSGIFLLRLIVTGILVSWFVGVIISFM